MYSWYRRWQTVLLGLLSFAVFVWGCISVFEVDVAVMQDYFVSALWMVGLGIITALLSVLIIKLLKHFR